LQLLKLSFAATETFFVLLQQNSCPYHRDQESGIGDQIQSAALRAGWDELDCHVATLLAMTRWERFRNDEICFRNDGTGFRNGETVFCNTEMGIFVIPRRGLS
jgi:hypothetical protein